ncbi:protein Skeletor, isoforms B/C-like [Dysidea avara]|uniref:protein Skeletor, isoforms B/C-like n=1 Tax=Dysidea avara TaxID=196820 RepID=UPI0033182687
MLLITLFAIVTQLVSYSKGEVLIGILPNIHHGVRGTLYAVDETTLLIRNFEYDGQGPSAYAYVYRRGATVRATGGGIIINWSHRSSDGRITHRYTGIDVTVLLRNQQGGDTGLTINNIGTFTIWCQRLGIFFSRIYIPVGLMPQPSLSFCAQLSTNFQVFWIVNASSNIARFELCSCISSDQYMAFGISGDTTRTFMVGADVVVAWVGLDGVANAVDYYINERQQCRGNVGVCPDTMVSGRQDNMNVTGSVSSGLTCVQYSRLLNTSDTVSDIPILANQSQFIVWAIGPVANEERLALFHTEYPQSGADYQINFSSAPTGDMVCSRSLQCTTENICGWIGHTITAMEPTAFRVRIGPSGGLRGYEYITGLSGWGIALYIDNKLAPVLRLARNVTYTFIVEAGNNANEPPNYHPFYITNSLDGGIMTNNTQQRANETVYAGYDVDTNTPLAAGRHCQHLETSSSGDVATNCSSRLDDYLNTLTVSCQGDESEAAILTWTPDDNTPDLVYYQCASHFHLGWKIELVLGSGPASGSIEIVTTPFFILMITLAGLVTTYINCNNYLS